MTNYSPYHYLDIGNAGEDLVAHWLQSQGWSILDRRWRCRWGEIDIVALYAEQIKDGEVGRTGDGESLIIDSPHHPYPTGSRAERVYTPSPHLPIAPNPHSLGGVGAPSSPSPILAFVEVKTRSPRNWDAGGRNAIASSKQVKLWRTAQMFLVAHPDKADYLCRFDVAIVSYQQTSTQFGGDKFQEKNLISTYVAGYTLTLQEYITGAFDLVNDIG
jgi:putative endonuclease